MFSSNALGRIEIIKKKIEFINFIAHHYEGIDLHVVEDVVVERLPIILKSTEQVLNLEK